MDLAVNGHKLTDRDRQNERINEQFMVKATQKDFREQDPQESTAREKSLPPTLEEEERPLASSPDVSIHAREYFESDSSPISKSKDPEPQQSEPMDQSTQPPQQDLRARPKRIPKSSSGQ